MTDRLKQLWSGFESVTTRHLTGSGVDNIARPHITTRHSDGGQAPDTLPENYSAPAQVAFDALKLRLASQEHRANKHKKNNRDKTSRGSDTPLLAGDLTNFKQAPESAKNMIRGLKATEDRVIRSPSSYVAQMSAAAGSDLNSIKKRKKFLGIF